MVNGWEIHRDYRLPLFAYRTEAEAWRVWTHPTTWMVTVHAGIGRAVDNSLGLVRKGVTSPGAKGGRSPQL